MSNVLVTGGAGFVGRHAVKRLCDDGYDVTVVDNMVSASSLHPELWMPHLKPRKQFKFIEEDCRGFFAKCQEKFDMIIHLAAIVGGRLSIENQPLSVAEDLAIDAMMFNWAVSTKQKKVIFLSSSAAYPIEYQTRGVESRLAEGMIDLDGFSIGKPDLSYGWAKLTGEYLARLAHSRNGLDVACFRPFSGYGEDQHTTYPFPSILQRVIESEGCKPIDVWGSGEQTRDFIYIDDCIDAILALSPDINDGSALNLGTGVGTSFSALVNAAHNILYGVDASVNCLIGKPEGVFYRVADTTALNAAGFTPSFDLAAGIERSLRFLGVE